jgi:anti-sigma factor RsiW
MHLDEERLQRLNHGELASPQMAASLQHLAACDECRQRLEEIRKEESQVHELLGSLDTPPPEHIEAVAQQVRAIALRARARVYSWLRRAAVLALVVGVGGIAYAIPGSPVRGWIHDVTRKLTGRPETPAPAPTPGRTGVSGVAVAPGDRLSILFEPGAVGAELRIDLTDGSDVEVHGPAGAAAYTSSAGYLLIRGRDSSAVLDVQIPRSAPWVEIRAQDERVFLKEGTRITTGGSRVGDRYVLPLPGRPAR